MELRDNHSLCHSLITDYFCASTVGARDTSSCSCCLTMAAAPEKNIPFPIEYCIDEGGKSPDSSPWLCLFRCEVFWTHARLVEVLCMHGIAIILAGHDLAYFEL
jgi:hypothetical protein